MTLSRVLPALSILCLSCLPTAVLAAEPNAQEIEFFEKKIRPVLVEHCWSCHSLDAPKLKGELRLDSREAVLVGGDKGPAIIVGQPEKSRLVEAIGYRNIDLQ